MSTVAGLKARETGKQIKSLCFKGCSLVLAVNASVELDTTFWLPQEVLSAVFFDLLLPWVRKAHGYAACGEEVRELSCSLAVHLAACYKQTLTISTLVMVKTAFN